MDYTELLDGDNMKFNIRHVPLVICLTLLILVIVTTSMAFYYAHITAMVPYISDTGTIPPESCIFGLFLNILWVLLSFTMYCKFKQVQDILQKHNMTHKNSFNNYTFIIGLLAAFGASIVGNFQETSSMIVHWIGAVMCFGLGAVYLCMQTSLYLEIAPVIGQMLLTKVRIVVSAVAVITFLLFFICAMVGYSKFEGQSYLHWTSENSGFGWHITSTVSEWICALSVIIFISFFGEEFKNFVIHEPVIDTGLVKQNNNSKRNSSAPDAVG